MPLFNTQQPTSTTWVPPDYIHNLNTNQRIELALSGYKNNGQRTGFGKIESWIPGLNIGSDLMAKNIANQNGATDSFNNINTNQQGDWGKLEAVGGAEIAQKHV